MGVSIRPERTPIVLLLGQDNPLSWTFEVDGVATSPTGVSLTMYQGSTLLQTSTPTAPSAGTVTDSLLTASLSSVNFAEAVAINVGYTIDGAVGVWQAPFVLCSDVSITCPVQSGQIVDRLASLGNTNNLENSRASWDYLVADTFQRGLHKLAQAPGSKRHMLMRQHWQMTEWIILESLRWVCFSLSEERGDWWSDAYTEMKAEASREWASLEALFVVSSDYPNQPGVQPSAVGGLQSVGQMRLDGVV